MRLVLSACLFLFLLPAYAQTVNTTYGDQSPVDTTFVYYTWGATSHVWSLVHLPDDYATTPSTMRYPALIFFHGAGEGSQNLVESDLHLISDTYGPCRELKQGKSMNFVVNSVLQKYIVICPQSQGGYWTVDGFALNGFVNSIFTLYPKIDANRLYMTGLSAGGYSLQAYGASNISYAQRLAAVAPVSADNAPNIDANICNFATSDVAYWGICGSIDAHSATNQQVVTEYNACTNRDYTANYTSIPGADHNSNAWYPAYSTDHSWQNPNLYEWLLQYDRSHLGPPTTPKPTSPPTPKPTPKPTKKPTPNPCGTAVIGSGTGLRGEYFSGTAFNTLLGVQVDPIINFKWGTAGPTFPNFPVNSFSARWTGFLLPKYTGTHTFYGASDDGIRVFVNGTQVLASWVDHTTATEVSGTYHLAAGVQVPFRVEYYEKTGQASVNVSWALTSCLTKEIIPQTQLTYTAFSVC